MCKNSCNKWKEEERISSTSVDSEGNTSISVSFDGAWQKRGKGRDSTTGFGTVIGENSGKILDYRVKCTRCRTCESAIDGNEPTPHDCRKNFTGSSKSMEPEIAVECFNAATNSGLKYSEYIADEDTTTESHVKYRVNYDAMKRTDKNHATRTLGSRLYTVQKSVRGLTAGVIHYITKLFAYCVSQNQGKSNCMMQCSVSLFMTTYTKVEIIIQYTLVYSYFKKGCILDTAFQDRKALSS